MTYEIVYTVDATKQLKKIPDSDAKRIVKTIRSFASNPRPHRYKKLVGWPDFYRFRVGDYRIIYQIVDAALIITIIEERRRNESTY